MSRLLVFYKDASPAGLVAGGSPPVFKKFTVFKKSLDGFKILS